MQRLVYNPSVSAWISTTDHGVVDISEYIVSGSVTRNINEVSTAELTIRNPDKKWTDPPGEPTFRPMDGITIWMNRFKSRPVQVFTGYLDTTPYLQLHPGVCSLSASCTLKRLLYTYFDPGLPYTRTWLRQYDWIVDSTTGQAKNINAQQTDKRELPKRLTDGGIGDLLYGTLADIGNWDDRHIKIEEVPRDLAKTLERIQDSFRTDKDKARQQLEDFLQSMIGSIGGGGGLSPDGSGPKSGSEVTPIEVGLEMLRAGFPADTTVIASGIETMKNESGFGTAYGWDKEHDGGVLGYWQIQLSSHPDVTAECAMNLRCSTKAAYKIWKGAGNCFACQAGPNPWQAGTDSGTLYIQDARKAINEFQG